MSQIPLGLSRKVSYSEQGFFVHRGVSQLIEAVLKTALNRDFASYYIYGERRSGKTHLSVKLLSLFADYNYRTHLITEENISNSIQELSAQSLSENDVVIIDSAGAYFSSIESGNSGEFVNFYQNLSSNGATLIMLSSKLIEQFSCDEHVTSRLLSSMMEKIDSPDASELSSLIELIAVQRGLKLTERQIDYLVVRLGHSIPQIEEYIERLIYLSDNLGTKVNQSLIAQAL